MKKVNFTQWQLWAQYLRAHDAQRSNPTLSKGEFFSLTNDKKVLVLTDIKQRANVINLRTKFR